MSDHWTHEPPCPRGGFVEVSERIACENDELCPLCGAGLTPPAEVAAHRARVAADDARLAASWEPPTPREILAMAAPKPSSPLRRVLPPRP